MSAHTPGPWRYDPDSTLVYAPAGDETEPIDSSTSLAEVVSTHADGALIASAPELLSENERLRAQIKALRKAAKRLSNDVDEDYTISPGSLIALRAALRETE